MQVFLLVEMTVAIITTLLCLTGLSSAFSTGLSRPRIINGKELDDISDYLYVVTLLTEDKQSKHFLCGGTLIDPRHVITAAHCIRNRLVNGVIVGSNNLIYDGSLYRALSARIHPHYTNGTFMPFNDIGIITLTENVREVTTFPKRRRRVFNDYQSPCKILGKGSVGFPENDEFSNKLKLGFVKQVPKSVCKQQWWKGKNFYEIAPHTLCMTSNEDAGICTGDSGGPLLCEGELTGVAFFGRACGTGTPDLYMDILFYNDWIDWVINSENYYF